jgi:hypothetical protein
VRSVGDVHGIERGGLPLPLVLRVGECRFAGLAAVKATIFEVVHVKSVSMPSEVFLDAGVDADRTEGRAGSVNERRAWVEACGACPGVFADAGTDMLGDYVGIVGWRLVDVSCADWSVERGSVCQLECLFAIVEGVVAGGRHGGSRCLAWQGCFKLISGPPRSTMRCRGRSDRDTSRSCLAMA